MSVLSLRSVKPSQINTDSAFSDTVLENEVMENVLRNLILYWKQTNTWTPITWEQYKEFTNGKAPQADHEALERLVERDVLSKEGDRYLPTNWMFRVLCMYRR